MTSTRPPGALEPGLAAITIEAAVESDAAAVADLHAAVAKDLTERHGRGRWSSTVGQASVLRAIRTFRVLVARDGAEVIGTLQLQTVKPWAIDRSYFADVERPIYLVSMAVGPGSQRRGIGRLLLDEAQSVARAWPAQSIRLDAYDADAGAGGFYTKCGFSEAGRVTYRGTPLIYYELAL